MIYEYFLANFALTEGQGAGEFFTPASIVRLIVEIIEPFHGRIFDPACGSGDRRWLPQHRRWHAVRRISDQREPIGLEHDAALVKPPNGDGLVNWLTTHLITALKHTAVMRTRTRIEAVDGVEICRVDVAQSSDPVNARMSDKRDVFWVRMNNSTRALPEVVVEGYVCGY